MAKLFAMEEQENPLEDKKLLIDKVLEYSKQKETPISLTADIIAKRQALKKEITKELNKAEEDSDDETNDSSDDSDSTKSDESKEPDDATQQSKDEDQSSDKKDESQDNSSDESDSKSDNDEDLDNAADDKESLKSLIGSGHKDDQSKKNDDTSQDTDASEEKKADTSSAQKEEVAKESYTVNLTTIFKPLQRRFDRYKVALEEYNVPFSLTPEKQPVAYVKDAVLESLENLTKIATTYIDNNTHTIQEVSESIKKINEEQTILSQYVDAEKHQFTNQLVSNKDILSRISCPGKSDLRTTGNTLLRYIDATSKVINLLLKNDFNHLKDAFTAAEFAQEGNDFCYREVLPGFNLIRCAVVPYQNYLKTDIKEFHYYKLKVLKTEDLYSLNAIDLSDDKELKYLITIMDKLLISVSTMVDNLNSVNEFLKKFIDEIKVMIYDIQNDKYKDLANIGLDDKVKDFIKFKLTVESSYININTVIEYMTTVRSVIALCVEFKD